jgi:hypothetical protein
MWEVENIRRRLIKTRRVREVDANVRHDAEAEREDMINKDDYRGGCGEGKKSKKQTEV